NGEFDKSVSIFVSKNLIRSSIKSRILKKDETEATPILSETEIKEAIKDAKEIGAFTAKIFFENGFIERTEDGYKVSEKIEKLLRLP
ncbi:MAG: hypothetical protein GYA51_16990, partial [Candidatus Methanofastidiosa archaeon]|nr:hypothetical protein [Candidatus Methanofastidiosa archaeon]